jgi:endo-1,4-beta-xylanase
VAIMPPRKVAARALLVWAGIPSMLVVSACSGSDSQNASAGASSGGAAIGGGGGTTPGGAGGAGGIVCDPASGFPTSFQWSSSDSLLGPVSDASHELAAIKDPTVVYFGDRWHVYASSVDASGSYNLVYRSFADFSATASATNDYLDTTLPGYHAAPELFYFTPQNKWYLLYQSGPPQYSTNDDPGNPAGWTRPTNFYSAEPAIVTANKGNGTWLDFWIICDSANCHLFFSDDNGHWYRSQTAIADFPNGFGDPVIVMQESPASRLFEASNVYQIQGTGKYLALIEAWDDSSSGHRYFRSWTADSLDGTWTALQDTYAAPFISYRNVRFAGERWTYDFSHGELIRAGYDERLAIDTCNLRFLYQGFPAGSSTSNYNAIPWTLGLLTQSN